MAALALLAPWRQTGSTVAGEEPKSVATPFTDLLPPAPSPATLRRVPTRVRKRLSREFANQGGVLMQVVLIMLRTGGDRRSFSVVRSTTTIGRREDCDLRIPVGDVSRKHCRLVVSADNVRLQDLGSSNGTYVNGQRVSDTFVNAGDTVGVGPVHFVVQIDGVPSEDEVMAPAPAAAESAIGGTGLAADALVAAEAGHVVEDAGLLEEVTEDPTAAVVGDDELHLDDVSGEHAAYAAGAPTESVADRPDEFTIDEDPAAAPASVQDVAFDLTTDTEPAPTADAEPEAVAEPVAAAPAADDDWNFLIEEPEGARSHADLEVDLDSSQGHPRN